MARGRMISKSLSTSEKYAALVPTAASLAEFCHVLYPLLLVHTDDFGRLQGDPHTVKLVCYPASTRSLADFGAALEHLHRVGLIAWYLVGTKRYIQIQNWTAHQDLRQPSPSIIPDTSGQIPAKKPPVSGINVHVFGRKRMKGAKSGKRREEKGTEEKRRSARASRGADLNDLAPPTGSFSRKSTDRRAPDGRAARAASAPLPPDKLALLKKYGFD